MHRLLAHIFDKSACLTRRQLKDYVTGDMAEEECYVVERHANDCSFCSEAIDGLSIYKGEGINLLETLTPEFIHDHFQKNLPPVHLNSIAPAAITEQAQTKHKKTGITWLQLSALMATVLLTFFLIRGWKTERRQITLPVYSPETMPAAEKEPETTSGVKNTKTQHGGKHKSGTIALPESPPAKTATAALQDEKNIGLTGTENKTANTYAHNDTETPADNIPSSEEHAPTQISTSGTDHASRLQLAGVAFDRSHYTTALHHYRQILTNTAALQEDKDAAGIMAARCYILLGSKAQAIPLLRDISKRNGSHSAEAEKLLAELD